MSTTMTQPNGTLSATGGRSLDIVETAKVVRSELKKAFPDTKFSVTTQRYSMGSSCTVRYTDGPPSKAVNACIEWISGKTFDGMDDSTHYHYTIYNGEPVQFSGYSPHISRTVADGTYERVEAILKQRFTHQDPEQYSPSYSGWHSLQTHAHRVISSWDARWETLERAVTRYIAERLS